MGGFGLAQRRKQFAGLAQRADIVGAHSPGYPLGRAEQIGQYRHGRRRFIVHRVFEQQGGARRAKHAVADLGHFEVSRYGSSQALEFARALELSDKVS